MKLSRSALSGAALAVIMAGALPLSAFAEHTTMAQLAGPPPGGGPPPGPPLSPGGPMPPGWRPGPRPLLAPPAPGKWWKNSEIARELTLTDAQVAQIEQAFLDHRLKFIDLRADLEKQEALLQPLLDVDRPDEARVAAQIDQVLAARGRLEKTQAMMLLTVRRVLSVEQWRRLQALQEREMPPPDRPMPGRMPHPPRPGG